MAGLLQTQSEENRMKNPLLILSTILFLLLLTLSCSSSRQPDTLPQPSPTPTPRRAFALSKTLTGRVVRIIDGDTCDIVDSQNETHRIRLKGINCPERGKPFSKNAKENLSALIYDKPVVVEWQKRDGRGRLIGKVMTDERDICLEQIKAGFAWHFKKYQDEQSEEDRTAYARAEERARASRLGLWGDPISREIPSNLRHHASLKAKRAYP